MSRRTPNATPAPALTLPQRVLGGPAGARSSRSQPPYNVQWQAGARAPFIDIPSFEPRGQDEPWVGYLKGGERDIYDAEPG